MSNGQQQERWLYFIRHGETDFNLNHVIQGSGVDSSLNQTGQKQAGLFYDFYRHIKFDLVICSNLQRSYQTITPFLNEGVPIEKYREINEINWGVHEGKKSNPWMIESYKKVVGQWKQGNYHAAVDQGESAQELSDRVSRFVSLVKKKPGQNILICSHGRTLRCLMCHVQGEPIHEMEKYQHSNTGLFLVRQVGDQLSLIKNNDVSHLNGSLS